ncbi:MAG: branched-chain amino acid ABC transporter permease, partial [Candidatus Microbacterium stercoravium]
GPQGRPVEGFPSATYAVGNVTFTLLQLTQAIVCIIVLIALGIALAHSKLGRAISAVRTNPELARSVGVPASRIGLLVFGVGSAMVAITAFFETAHFVATPTMGLQPVIYGFIGMFIGGISSLKGAAVGGFVLGFLLVFSGLFLSQNLGVLLVFAALVLVVIVRPEGLLSGAKR